MSAPEVRITSTFYAATAHGSEWTAYDAECGGCGQDFSHWRESDTHEWAQRHEETCAPLALARLQARWDARDEAERALVETWRERQAKHSGFYGESSLADGYEICADELERAIGGGE